MLSPLQRVPEVDSKLIGSTDSTDRYLKFEHEHLFLKTIGHLVGPGQGIGRNRFAIQCQL